MKMPTELPIPAQETETSGFRVTGRFVLFCFLGFFGVIAAVNFTMARYAVTTFGGVETASSYKAGLSFRAETNAAHAQDALGWNVDVRLTRDASGMAALEVRPVDGGGRPLTGLDMIAELRHPSFARKDHEISITETAPGIYTGTAAADAGQWQLRLDLLRNGERMFRSESRASLR